MLIPSANFDDEQVVSVGVLFDSSNYVWVAHQKITTNSSAVDYESSGSIINLPSTMKKGETVLIQAELTSVTPFANYSLSVFNPLGYDDVFHIGAPELAVGGSYECNDQSLWKSTPKTTISGSSTGKI